MSGGPNRVGATFWLLEAPDSLAEQSRREPDGTGLGCVRRPTGGRTSTSSRWRPTRTQDVRARGAGARARARSSPTSATRRPAGSRRRTPTRSSSDGRLFAHNGVIEDLERARARARRRPMRWCTGDTDSERFFALITREIERDRRRRRAGSSAAARWVAADLPVFALNMRADHRPTSCGRCATRTCTSCCVLERGAGGPSGDRHLDARERPRLDPRPLGDLAARPRWSSPASGWTRTRAGARSSPASCCTSTPTCDVTITGCSIAPPAHQLTLADLTGKAASSQARERLATAPCATMRPTMATDTAHAARAAAAPRGADGRRSCSAGPRFINACRRRYGDVGHVRDAVRQPVRDGVRPGAGQAGVPGLARAPARRRGQRDARARSSASARCSCSTAPSTCATGELLLPPFHGRRMQAYAQVMRESADLEIDSWPVGEPFALMPEHAVADAAGDHARRLRRSRPGADEQELARRAAGDDRADGARPRADAAAHARPAAAATARRSARSRQRARAVDELLYAEIARRRDDPDARRARRRVLGAAARRATRTASALSDREVRDELVTLLARRPRDDRHRPGVDLRPAAAPPARARARALRGRRRATSTRWSRRRCGMRPVIPGVGRVVRGEPFALDG